MKLKEKISFKEINGTVFKISIYEALNHGRAALTHYLHNQNDGDAKYFKTGALNFVKLYLEYKTPDEKVTTKVAEEALQYLLFDYANKIPFPGPKKPKFKFIDLFAGIGGFRIALQNLGGKCVFSSEWDEQSQKTYEANFGEVPLGI